MKEAKRALSVTLALSMLLSAGMPGALAAEENEPPAAQIAATQSEETYQWLNHDRVVEYPAAKTAIRADSTQGGYGTELMLDGNEGTKWEASWSGAPEQTTLTVELEEAEYVTGFMYTSRQDNNISGVMTDYTVYVSQDGTSYEEELTQGTLPYRLDTFFVTFDEPVLAKGIQIVSTAKAITELRLTYLPNDYDGLLADAHTFRDPIQPGSDINQWTTDALDAFDTALEQVEDAGKPEDPEALHQACVTIFGLISELKRAQQASTADLQAAYRQAETLRNAAVEGEDPLQWPADALSAFDGVMEQVGTVAGVSVASRGAVLDAQSELDEGLFAFKRAQVKPDMSGSTITGGNLEGLMDGVTANRYQSREAAGDKSKYIELDYKNETRFESLTFYSWFANRQAVQQFQVQVKTDGEWVDVDGGKTYTIPWSSYSQKPSEKQTVAFDTPVQGTALRICVVVPGDNGGIDELEVGIGVSEDDMSISLDKDALTLEEGQSAQITATVLPSHATNKTVIWTSSQPDVVSVDNTGLVKGLIVPEGSESVEVTITATTEYGGKTDTCTVTLIPKQAGAEEKADTERRVEILDKLAAASKPEDYQTGALDAFKAEIAQLKSDLSSESLTVGDLAKLDTRCAQARETFDAASLIPLRTVAELIDRVTGENSSQRFILEMIPADPENGMDVYEVDWDSESGKPVLRGNDAVSLATAYNYYLKYFAYLDFPYVGDCDLVLPETMPEVTEKVRIVFPYENRHYFNENCEYKYTTALYTKEEWTHRLDWMAMNGFNMFLLDIGEHAVWLNAADELGLNEAAKEEIRRANKGTEQYYAKYELSSEAVAQEGELAKFVAQRGMDLGMEPEIRPFVGQLLFMFPNNHDDYYGSNPKRDFVVDLEGSVFDGVKAYPAARWFNLPQGIFISPEVAPGSSEDEAAKAKEVFNQVADIYYASLMEVFGFDEYGRTPVFGFKDMVGEQGFVVQHEAFPQKVIQEMSELFLELNPDSVWMQTSWRYSDWLVKQYKPGSLLFVDLKADNNPKWQGTNEFGGTPWVWSMLFNFGGNTGLGGGFEQITNDVINAHDTAQYMTGVSISPEGGDTNPALYALMAEMTWRSEAPDLDQWLKDYAKRRYGAENYTLAQEELDSVWQQLYATVYSGNCPGGADGPSQTLINAYPKLGGTISRIYGTNNKVYETKDIIPIWAELLDAAEKITAAGGTLTEQFKYDLVDITRQALGDISGEVYNKITPAYNANNKEEALKYAGLMVDLCEQMDKILATNRFFLLGTRLEGAKNRGVTDSDKLYFEKVERTFLTYWILDNYDSGGLRDYCNRHLAGLMTDYYGMRWQAMYDELERAMTAGSGQYSQSNVDAVIREKNITWSEDRTPYTAQAQGDCVAVSREILSHYTALIQELYLDGGALRELYEANKDREDIGYPEDAWNAFTAALDNAKQVLDTALTAEELDAAYQTLLEAIETLEESFQGADGVFDVWHQDEATVVPDAGNNQALCGTVGEDGELYLKGSTANGQNDDAANKPAIFVNETLNGVLSATEQNTVTFDFVAEAELVQSNPNTDKPLPVFGFYMNYNGVNDNYFVGYNGSAWNWQRYGSNAGWGNVSGPAIECGKTYTVKIQWTGTHLDLFQIGLKGGQMTTVMDGTGNGANMAEGGAGKGFAVRVGYSDWYKSLTALTLSNFQYSGQAEEQTCYTVSGTVLDGGAAVAGATVTDGSARAITDSQGRYTLYVKAAGETTLTASVPGKDSVTRTVTVTEQGNTGVDISMDGQEIRYTIRFNGNGGTGAMEEVSGLAGEPYTLPECGFTAPEGQQFKCWNVGGQELAPGQVITVSGDTEVTAVWADLEEQFFTITVKQSEGGTITPDTCQVKQGESQTFTIQAAADYELTDVLVDGVSVGAVGTYTFEDVQADHSIEAVFTPVSTAVTSFAIQAKAGEGGSISPRGSVWVPYGLDKTFTITADEGYVIADVLVDGKSVGAVSTYTFEKVKEKHTIEAVFKAADGGETGTGFTDVPDGAWYAEAVAYVTEQGLMNGTAENTFSPMLTMSRSMLVTVLYRLAGEPEVGENPFTDVPAGQWYTDAVAWAAANGIVTGVSDTTFAPDAQITRESLAVMLCRYAAWQKQDVSARGDLTAFADSASVSDWAEEAVAWAVGEGIITGKSGNTLDPQGTATRAEVAAILMRFCQKDEK